MREWVRSHVTPLSRPRTRSEEQISACKGTNGGGEEALDPFLIWTKKVRETLPLLRTTLVSLVWDPGKVQASCWETHL